MGKRSKSKIKSYSQLIEEVRALGLSGRSAKKMARLCKVRQMEFSTFEKNLLRIIRSIKTRSLTLSKKLNGIQGLGLMMKEFR